MRVSCVRRKTCRLCGSSQVVLGAQFIATPPGDLYATQANLNRKEEEFPLDLFLCVHCGNIQLLDVVDPTLIYANYLYCTKISVGLPEYFCNYASEVLRFVAPSTGSLILDIGSNDGTLLRCIQKQGFKVLGIDPAPIAKAATESGVETLQAFFTTPLAQELIREHGTLELVTANNVVANIDDLEDFFNGIHVLIGPKGCFVFETGYGLDLVDQKLLDVIHHEHLSYFTVGSLARSLGRYGLELVHVEHTTSKGGCIRFYIQREKGPRKVDTSVHRIIQIEAEKGIERLEAFGPFNRFIAETKERLTKELLDLKKQGKSIAGYGASVGTTTLEYLFNLADKMEYVVDDNPGRLGLFTPGHHIPVYSSQMLYEKKPDYVVVFAWRYMEPILKKHGKFLSQGGHFLTFLPEYKIYGSTRSTGSSGKSVSDHSR